MALLPDILVDLLISRFGLARQTAIDVTFFERIHYRQLSCLVMSVSYTHLTLPTNREV